MIFAVFDTNVLIASLLSKHYDSATVQVVDAISTNKIIPLYNYEILAEYDEILRRKKFQFSEKRIEQVLSVFQAFGINVGIPTSTGEILPDEDDLVFYEVAMEKQSDNAYLITGNLKHFPHRTFIVTPAEMMQILAQHERKKEENLEDFSNTANEKSSVLAQLKHFQSLIKQSSQEPSHGKNHNNPER